MNKMTPNLVVKEVEKKIKSLRTQYMSENAKAKKNKSEDGADAVYVPKWIFYTRLSFLDEFVTAKNSRSNLQVGVIITSQLFSCVYDKCTQIFKSYCIAVELSELK